MLFVIIFSWRNYDSSYLWCNLSLVNSEIPFKNKSYLNQDICFILFDNFKYFSEFEESANPEEENLPPHPTGIRLHRVGYYTIPHLDELPALMDSDGRCIVENFTIGRVNYGNIFYPDSFDVSGLNLDEIGLFYFNF